MANPQGFTVGVSFKGDLEMIATINNLRKSMVTKYTRNALKRCATPLKKEIRRRAPDSRNTGSRQYWSKKLKMRRGHEPHIKDVIKDRPSSNWPSGAILRAKGITGISVGPGQGRGSITHLLERGHRGVFWGRNKVGAEDRDRPLNDPLTMRGFKPGGFVGPFPFMRPALMAVAHKFPFIIKQTIWNGIERDLRAGRAVF